MSLTQRLARAAILSHVETDEILHSPAVSSSRPPLNFVAFQKFATPPSSRTRPVERSTSSRVRSSEAKSHSEPSAAIPCEKRCKSRYRISKQPGSERPSCLPLTFIPLREAEDAYAAKFS